MGRIVKLVGSGIGLASEAIHHHRSRSRSRDSRSSANPAQPSSSTQPVAGQSAEGIASSEPRTRDVTHANRSDNVEDDSPPDYYTLANAGKETREKKSEETDEEDDDDDDDSISNELAADEAAWELDEMTERVAPPSYDASEAATMPTTSDSEEVKVKKEEIMVRGLVQMAGPPPEPIQRLPCPVIIPQRRPRNKSRGFVRAYAPVLQDSGIGQDLFFKFMSDWEVASRASPWIDVIMVAATVAGFVPEVATQIVSTVVSVAAGTAKELQNRYRRNTFLDRVNQDLFMPRGLYAMVMTFKDELPGQQQGGPLSRLSSSVGAAFFKSERLDINQTAAKYSNPDPEMSKMKQKLKDIRLTSGKTYTQLELPEAAALTYPTLDRAAEKQLEAEGKGKEPEKSSMKDQWKSAGNFVQDYFDRKAQAAYETQNQGSSLAVPSSAREQFHSRFSDPNHPANSGSLISLITGGHVNLREGKQKRRMEKWNRRNDRRAARGLSPRPPPRRLQPRSQKKGIIKKILQQDVLYFIIVNLPTESEVQQSVARLEEVMSKQSHTV
ncbi:hypothetical protein BGZ63DRAFT_426360 [Mariannaea sp. PMI_226]|nr:hypothetical protein BGZ63DRAFT_426360 [Mariannaea sp. PMI_226]